MPASVLDQPCHLCDILQYGVGQPFSLIFPGARPVETEILLHNEHLALVLDVAPIVEGYLLAFAVNHQPSFGAGTLGDLSVALEQMIATCETAFRTAYQLPILAFEHGSRGAERSRSCCIEHAHLHIVPFAQDLLDPRAAGFHEASSLAGLHEEVGTADYLYYRDLAGRHWFRSPSAAQPQFFRRLLAEKVGNSLWNWTDYLLLRDSAHTRELLLRGRSALEPVLPRGV